MTEQVFRSILALDIEQYGHPERNDQIRIHLRALLRALLSEALASFDTPQTAWTATSTGDGLLALIDPVVPVASILRALMSRFRKGLSDYNRSVAGIEVCRVRIVLHAGFALLDEDGAAGEQINLVFRLLDSDALRACLASASGPVVIAISDQPVYEQVVRNRLLGLDPGAFEPIQVAVKETRTLAWVHVPRERHVAALAGVAGPTGPGILARIPGRQTAEPFQVPPDIDDFTGRAEPLRRVRELTIRRGRSGATAVVITTLDGQGGVGKTALAVRACHQLRTAFPHGQLYVNLRGAEALALDPAEVLAGFLRDLGVDGPAIPESLEERVRMYRSRLADRRMLVLLDNAANEQQVRPLLPNSSSCAVLVTSRSRLATLEGATAVHLEVMDPESSVELLARIVGIDRVVGDLEAARSIARLCGHLPLALRIAGARLAQKRHWSLSRLEERLRDERNRLDELQTGDLEVRASFALSYDNLPRPERRIFRMLGLLRAGDFAAWTAAALLGVDLRRAEELLERLVDAQLLESAGEDATGQMRYRFHDLLRVFAFERLTIEDEPDREEALVRALNAYLVLAVQANIVLERGAWTDVAADLEGRTPQVDLNVIDRVQAMPVRWFAVEQASLSLAVDQAHEGGHWRLVWELASALVPFFEMRAVWSEWEHAHNLALDAARRAANDYGLGVTLHNRGRLYWIQGRWQEAFNSLEECLSIFKRLGDGHWVGRTLRLLGGVYKDQNRWDEALSCFERCLPLLKNLGLARWEATALRTLGEVYHDQGKATDAIDCFMRCLPVFRELGDRRWEAVTLRSLGEANQALGLGDDAQVCYEQAMSVFREIGDRREEGVALFGLGQTFRNRGRWQESRNHLEACLTIFNDLGDRRWQAKSLSLVGLAAAATGDYASAHAAWNEALPVLESLGLSEASHVRAWLEKPDRATGTDPVDPAQQADLPASG